MRDVEVETYLMFFDKSTLEVLNFVVDGVADDENYTLEEAIKAYPKTEYNWIEMECDDYE